MNKPIYIEYAGQVVDLVHDGIRISAKACLHPLTERDNIPYLKTLSDRSIYFFSLFQFKGEDKRVSANLPIRDLPDITARTQAAMSILMKMSLQSSTEKTFNKIPAGLNPLTVGKLKGKSPIEWIVEDDASNSIIATLTNQQEFLKKKMGQYTANQKDFYEIRAALELYQGNGLDYLKNMILNNQKNVSSANKESQSYTLYKSEWKHQPNSKPDVNGKKLCYQMSIMCYPVKDKPFVISIQNCKAPVEEKASGLMPIKFDAAEDKKQLYFNMTSAEWNQMLQDINDNLSLTKQTVFRKYYELDLQMQAEQKLSYQNPSSNRQTNASQAPQYSQGRAITSPPQKRASQQQQTMPQGAKQQPNQPQNQRQQNQRQQAMPPQNSNPPSNPSQRQQATQFYNPANQYQPPVDYPSEPNNLGYKDNSNGYFDNGSTEIDDSYWMLGDMSDMPPYIPEH